MMAGRFVAGRRGLAAPARFAARVARRGAFGQDEAGADPLHRPGAPSCRSKRLLADRRHRFPERRHRVTNWTEHDASLRARGSPTVWFTAEAIEAWRAGRRTTRGGQPRYSGLVVATALAPRAVFRPTLRRAKGLIASILQVLGLDLAVLDHSTLSRRAGTPEVPRPGIGIGRRPSTPAGGQHGAQALRPRRVADGEARHQDAARVAEAPSGHRCRHRPDRRDDADRPRCRRRLPDRPPARPYRRSGGVPHRRRRVRPRRRLRRGRGPPSGCGRHRTTARASAVPGEAPESEAAEPDPTQRDRHLQLIAERGQVGWSRPTSHVSSG
jgi:hypothetical protein